MYIQLALSIMQFIYELDKFFGIVVVFIIINSQTKQRGEFIRND